MSMLSPDSPFYSIEETRVIKESADAIAFYDKYPVSEGHTLIIPVTQAASI